MFINIQKDCRTKDLWTLNFIEDENWCKVFKAVHYSYWLLMKLPGKWHIPYLIYIKKPSYNFPNDKCFSSKRYISKILLFLQIVMIEYFDGTMFNFIFNLISIFGMLVYKAVSLLQSSKVYKARMKNSANIITHTLG